MMNAETDSVMEVEDFGFNGFDLLPLELLRHVFLNLWSPADFANVQGTCRSWKSVIADPKMDRDPLRFNSWVLRSFLAGFNIPMSEVMSAWRVYYVPNRIAVVASSIDMKTGAPKGHGYVLLLEHNAAIYAVWDGFTTCDNVVSYVSIGSRLVRGHVSITIDSTRGQVTMDPTRMKARREEIGTAALVFGKDGLPQSGTVGGSHSIHFGGVRKCWIEGDGTRTYESEKVRIAGQHLNYHGTLRFSITPQLGTDLSLTTITGAGVKVSSGVFYYGIFVNGLFLRGSVYNPGNCIVIGEFNAPTRNITLPDSWGLFYDIKNNCLQENQYRYGTPVTMRDCITMQSHTAYTPRDVIDLYTKLGCINPVMPIH